MLYGGRGDDTLVVNGSNITALAVNTGNASQAIARIDGGNGTDTVSYASSGAGVTVNLGSTVAQVSTGDASGDVLDGIENVTGSTLGDQLLRRWCCG